jgi:tetratricopeptide (TPR) repeat protein
MPDVAARVREYRGNYAEAGRMYLRASRGETGAGENCRSAIRCFRKAGSHEEIVAAYVEVCTRFGTNWFYHSDWERLHELGLLELVCVKLGDVPLDKDQYAIYRVADIAKRFGFLQTAGDLYMASGTRRKDQYDFIRAVECYKRGNADSELIRRAYEEAYRRSDHFMLPGGAMEWLWQSGELPTFVRNLMRDHPGTLWNELDDFLREHGEDCKTPEAYEQCAELLAEIHEYAENEGAQLTWGGARLPQYTYKNLAKYFELVKRYDRAAHYYVRQLEYTDHGYSKKAAECYVKAGMYREGAKLYERRQEFELAATAYEAAGTKLEAARCYRIAAKGLIGQRQETEVRRLTEKAEALEREGK